MEPTVWSRNSARSDNGEIAIAGVKAGDLVAEFGTPVYVVDEADAIARATEIKNSFDSAFAQIGTSVKVYYAGKAFLCTEVARWMTTVGLNVDVASAGEMAVALAAGVDASRLGFHGNNKSVAEIDRAVRVGIGPIVIDSAIEIERIAAAAARHNTVQRVRLRINSGVHASTHEYLATAREDQKFGIPLTEAEAMVAQIRSHPSLDFVGIHSHIGSQIFDTAGFAEAARRLLELHARLSAVAPVPELNLGGGFGIAYTSVDEALPVAELAKSLASIVDAECSRLGIDVPLIAIEPGRSIIGPSTTTLYTAGTIKDVLVEGEAVRKYVSVDGGMSDNLRPALYAAEYSARIANRVSDVAPELVRIAGKHCEAGDIVVRAEYLPGDVSHDDIIAVPATGAYGWAMSNNYNYIARPPVVAVRDAKARIIVRGESEEDLLSRDAGITLSGDSE